MKGSEVNAGDTSKLPLRQVMKDSNIESQERRCQLAAAESDVRESVLEIDKLRSQRKSQVTAETEAEGKSRLESVRRCHQGSR